MVTKQDPSGYISMKTNNQPQAQIVAEEDLKPGDTIIVRGVDWDSEGEAGLPDFIELTLPDSWEAGDDISDLISDKSGWCIFGYGQIELISSAQ